MSKTALIVGTGRGISASFARMLAREGYDIALTARNSDKLADLARETKAKVFSCDATNIDQVATVYAELDRQFGRLDIVLYNPSARAPGTIVDLSPTDVAHAINITAYALPFAAYFNPQAAGGATGINLAFWFFAHILFESKMMAIFSMLFGAGVILMYGRAQAAGRPFRGVYYRRIVWLLVIGLVHAYVLWYGDILVT